MKGVTPSSKDSEWGGAKTQEAPGERFAPQDLVDPKREPEWPSGDYRSKEYQAASVRRAAWMAARERLLEEIAVARILARRRLSLAAQEATALVPALNGPLSPEDPRVSAWRFEVARGLEDGVRVYAAPPEEDEEGRKRESALDIEASVRRAEDVLACLRLLRDDVAVRGGGIPASAPGGAF